MEIDYMKGITTSNAISFPWARRSRPRLFCFWWMLSGPRIEIQSDLRFIISIYVTNIIFTKFVDLAENSKPAITLGGLSLIQFKWNSLYFRSENRLMRSFIKTYGKAGELERDQNLWNQLFKNIKKVEEGEETLPKALWTQPLTALTGFAYSAYSAYSTYSTYSAYSA